MARTRSGKSAQEPTQQLTDQPSERLDAWSTAYDRHGRKVLLVSGYQLSGYAEMPYFGYYGRVGDAERFFRAGELYLQGTRRPSHLRLVVDNTKAVQR